MNKNIFQNDLLLWYKANKRILPWRNDTSAYRVWISEIMLQQTRVDTVIPYFNRFIETLPSIKDVSLANDDTLNKLWEGLGYYSRVRNIKKAAIQIMEEHNGVFPSDYDSMLALPGIGPYTAGAISSIAFNTPYTAVDGNVLRVFSRIFGIKDNIKDEKTKKKIKSLVQNLLPKDVSSFNQGLMEIGALICKPNGKPSCEECPFSTYCEAHINNLTDEIPFIIRKSKKRNEEKTVIVLRYNNLFAIEKRSPKGLLANLYQFPLYDNHLSITDVQDLYKDAVVDTFILNDSKHIFSHINWFMKGYLVIVNKKLDGYTWASIDEIIDKYSIPTAFKEYRNFIKK